MIDLLMAKYKEQVVPKPDAKLFAELLKQKHMDRMAKNRAYQAQVAKQNQPWLP